MWVVSVSIHTPTKGVTRLFCKFESCKGFQSTHPRRVWQLAKGNYFLFVSFNPHTHEGCDDDKATTWDGIPLFQSTHPRRVWRVIIALMIKWIMFQSTHPRRVWHIKGTGNYPQVEFQSTHPRRVWLSKQTFCHLIKLVSIHTPTKGVTQQLLEHSHDLDVSIHTPTKGVTLPTAG